MRLTELSFMAIMVAKSVRIVLKILKILISARSQLITRKLPYQLRLQLLFLCSNQFWIVGELLAEIKRRMLKMLQGGTVGV